MKTYTRTHNEYSITVTPDAMRGSANINREKESRSFSLLPHDKMICEGLTGDHLTKELIHSVVDQVIKYDGMAFMMEKLW